jgi:tRNA threonylcarbamoyladenosine biosynthesis protein TsaB
MLVLTIRTDKPESEIGLYNGNEQLAYETWMAHRQLAETLHSKIKALLTDQGKTLQDIQGIVAFQGPGSFTGLRIGLTVANAIAYSLKAPIVATQGEDWIAGGIARLQKKQNDTLALPYYGAEANITLPKH